MAYPANSSVQTTESQENSFRGLYDQAFPNGSKTMLTTAADHECGLDAIVQSMRGQYTGLPQLTLEELRNIAREPELHIKITRYYADDEIEKILRYWGESHGLNLRLGIVPGDLDDFSGGPGPMPFTWPIPDRAGLYIVWIHNDLAEDDVPLAGFEIYNHWSGLEPKPVVHGQHPSTHGIAMSGESRLNGNPGSEVELAQNSQAVDLEDQSKPDPSAVSQRSKSRNRVDELNVPQSPASQHKQPKILQDENQQRSVSPTQSAQHQPASAPTAQAEPKKTISSQAPQPAQPRRSARLPVATAKAVERDQQPKPQPEPEQKVTKTKKQAPEHRYLCMIGECKSSYNDLDRLNAHRKTKHDEDELTNKGAAKCMVKFTEWLAGDTRATVPASMLERWKHVLPDSSPESPSDVAPTMAAGTQKTASKRKATPHSTAEDSKRPARGQGKEPEQSLRERADPEAEIQEHQSQADTVRDSLNPAADPKSKKRKRAGTDDQDTRSSPKRPPIIIKLNVRSVEAPPSAEDLTQSHQDQAPKPSKDFPTKVSRPVVSQPRPVSLPTIDEELENGRLQATAPDTPPSDSSSESSDDDVEPSQHEAEKESEGEHMEQWRNGFEASSQKKSATARSQGRVSSYQWGQGQRALAPGQIMSKTVFKPNSVSDAIPASLHKETAAKKAARSKKDKKSNECELEEAGPQGWIDREPLLEANAPRPDAETLKEVAEYPKLNEAAAKDLTAPDDPYRMQSPDLEDCTDMELRDRLKASIEGNLHTRHGGNLLSEIEMAEKAGRIRITSTRSYDKVEGRGTVEQKKRRQENDQRDHDDNLIILAALNAIEELLNTNQQLDRDHDKTDLMRADEIARLQKELKMKDSQIEAKKAEIARLKEQHPYGEALKLKDEQLEAQNAELKAQAREITNLEKHIKLSRFAVTEERKTINQFAIELDEAERKLEGEKRVSEEQIREMEAETTGQGIIRTSPSLKLLLEAMKGQDYSGHKDPEPPLGYSDIRGEHQNGDSGADGWPSFQVQRGEREADPDGEHDGNEEEPRAHDNSEVGDEDEPKPTE